MQNLVKSIIYTTVTLVGPVNGIQSVDYKTHIIAFV